MPLADGGEGVWLCWPPYLTIPNGSICHSVDALHRPIIAQYLTCGNKAYIELAKASGLPLIHPQERDLFRSNIMAQAC